MVEETARRRRIESRFVEILESAGFDEVLLPIIDYAEPYAPLASNDSKRQSYRFVDREGELVAIRSDFTPMVARALAPTLTEDALPLRVFYRGDVIRCDASRLGTNREIFQIGAEIIGDASTDADAEVMSLAATIARAFGKEPRVVFSGSSSTALDAIGTRFDEDEDNGYYTGVRFRVYTNGRRAPVAQGGRYDNLYARFGANVPAIGFTFTVDDLCE